MVFSSYIFIAAFLPIVLLFYYLLAKAKNDLWQRLFLIGASLVFYGYYNVSYLVLIIASIVVNYGIALGIRHAVIAGKKTAGRLSLAAGIVFNVALIGYYKYYDFFIENINAAFHTDFLLKNIALPLGISFFTFQQLSFLVSVYQQEEKVERLRDYCLFVMFFPQLVAGPIVLYSEMIPQFKEESRRYFHAGNFSSGLYLFAIGLFKKAVIADTLALFVSNGFSMHYLTFTAGWATALSYTLQIYFDFSGYSDMAVGLGRMFNIDLPFNFLSPYKSKSITDFWKTWHITLGRALSTYIYKPLGGNRKGQIRTCINLFLTFLVSGLWHGAAWTFVLWGALHGLFRVAERVISEKRLSKIPQAVRICATFLTVNFLWVLFRAENFTQAMNVYRGMFRFSDIGISSLAAIAMDGVLNFPAVLDYAYLIGLLLLLLFLVFRCKNSAACLARFRQTPGSLLFAVLLFCVSLLHLTRESVFIYFNF